MIKQNPWLNTSNAGNLLGEKAETTKAEGAVPASASDVSKSKRFEKS
jgi:hypothetical protein